MRTCGPGRRRQQETASSRDPSLRPQDPSLRPQDQKVAWQGISRRQQAASDINAGQADRIQRRGRRGHDEEVHQEGRLSMQLRRGRRGSTNAKARGHSKKPRSNQFRDGAALLQPQTGQLDEVAEVEHGVRSPRLRGAKIEDLTLQLVFEDTLGAPSSSAWQHTQKLRAKLCAILGSGLPANTCGAGWQTSLWPRAKGVP